MPDLPRIPATTSQRSFQIAWTVTALGSAYISYNYVASKQYNSLFNKIGYPLKSEPPLTRMNILLYFVGIRVLRQLLWLKFNVLELQPTTAVVIQIFTFINDILAITLAARNNSPSPNLTDKIGIFLFTIGSLLETGYDYQRWAFKQDPSNAGKPYMEGLAKYVVHPNYLGYTVWRTGFALVSGNPYLTTILPLYFSYDFIFKAIPGLQAHNKKKYGKPYEDYLANTWNFIPLIW